MKRSLIAFFALLFITPVFATPVVFGETGDDTGSNQSSQTDSDNSDTEQETEADKSARSARIKQLIEAKKIRLAEADKAKLKAKCRAAQGKVSSVGMRLKGVETSREQVYKNIQNRLNNAVTKLKEKGIDTTQLEAEIATLNTMIETYKTTLTTYKQSVTDLKAMDCQADPDGFKAALEAARMNLAKVHEDAKAVRMHLKEVIRPLLTSLKQQLEGQSSTENETNNEQGGTQ